MKRLTLQNDHDWGNVFWSNKASININDDGYTVYICHQHLVLEMQINQRIPALDILTSPRCPAHVSDNVFPLNWNGTVKGRDGDINLSIGLATYLQKAYKDGDRYAWIEY